MPSSFIAKDKLKTGIYMPQIFERSKMRDMQFE